MRSQLLIEQKAEGNIIQRVGTFIYDSLLRYENESPWRSNIAKNYRWNYELFSAKYLKRADLLKAMLDGSPEIDEISPDKNSASQHVKLMISGGTFRPFSYPVAKNHA